MTTPRNAPHRVVDRHTVAASRACINHVGYAAKMFYRGALQPNEIIDVSLDGNPNLRICNGVDCGQPAAFLLRRQLLTVAIRHVE